MEAWVVKREFGVAAPEGEVEGGLEEAMELFESAR